MRARARAPDQPDPKQQQAQQHRWQRLAQIAAKGQLQHRTNQHVLRVADQRGGGPDVGSTGQPEQKRHRVEAALQAQLRHHRGHGQADDVVGKQRRQSPGDSNDRSQQGIAPKRQRRHPACDRGVKTAQAHLCRHHHEREQQQHRGQIHRAGRCFGAHGTQANDRNGAQQRHAGAVQFQARQAAQHHADVHHHKNGHDAPVGQAVCGHHFTPVQAGSGRQRCAQPGTSGPGMGQAMP